MMRQFAVRTILVAAIISILAACSQDDTPASHQEPLVTTRLTSDTSAIEIESYPSPDSAWSAANQIRESAGAIFEKGDFAAAEHLYQTSLATLKSIDLNKVSDELRPSILEDIIRCYQNIGLCYHGQYNMTVAKSYYGQCADQLEAFEKNWGFQSLKRRARVLHTLGQLHGDEGNISEAFLQYEKERIYLEKMLDTDPNKATGFCSWFADIGSLYVLRRDANKIIEYSEKAIRIYEANRGEGDFQIGSAYNNLSYGLFLRGQYDQAIEAADLAYRYYSEVQELPGMQKTLHNRAMAFRGNKQFEEAHATIDEAIEIWNSRLKNDKVLPFYYENLASNYSNKADVYLDEGKFEKALGYYEKAITTFISKGSKGSAANKLILDKAGLIEAYEGKAKSLHQLKRSKEAAVFYKEAIALVNEFKFGYSDEADKASLAEVTKKVFEGAIAINVAQGTDPNELLGFSEQSKAFVLLESVKKQQFLQGVDPESLKKEKMLRESIYGIEKGYAEGGGNLDSILELKQLYQDSLNEVLQVLNSNFRYRQLLSDIQPLELSFIQRKLLQKDQALLEFFVGEEQSFLFLLHKKGTLEILPIPIHRNKLIRLVQDCRQGILGKGGNVPDSPEELDLLYTQAAYQLYDALFPASIRARLPERLLIIPDDVLGYLPFDALLQEQASRPSAYKSHAYLGKKFRISYAYSAAMQQEMQQSRKSQKNINKILAFAYPRREDLFIDQVDSLVQKVGAAYVKKVGLDGGKQFLRDSAQYYRYIHLATHGSADDQEPNFSFLAMHPSNGEGESVLYLYEIYGIALNADMVFLSACETGTGHLYRGEGIMSLARGFSYAGTQSIVTTLWKINQQSSNTLVNNFYGYLKGGKYTKDEALFKAKNQYLEDSNFSDADAAPDFWAGFVPIGNMNPPDLGSKSSGLLWAFVIATLLVVFGWVLWRRFR